MGTADIAAALAPLIATPIVHCARAQAAKSLRVLASPQPRVRLAPVESRSALRSPAGREGRKPAGLVHRADRVGCAPSPTTRAGSSPKTPPKRSPSPPARFRASGWKACATAISESRSASCLSTSSNFLPPAVASAKALLIVLAKLVALIPSASALARARPVVRPKSLSRSGRSSRSVIHRAGMSSGYLIINCASVPRSSGGERPITASMA